MPRTSNEQIQERLDFVKTVTDCAQSPTKFAEVFLDHKVFDYNRKYLDCKEIGRAHV